MIFMPSIDITVSQPRTFSLIERFHGHMRDPKFHSRNDNAFSWLMHGLSHPNFTIESLVRGVSFNHLAFDYQTQREMSVWLLELRTILEGINADEGFDITQLTDEEVKTVMFYNYQPEGAGNELKQKIAQWYLQEIQTRPFPTQGKFLSQLLIYELLKHEPRSLTVDSLERILSQVPLNTLLCYPDMGIYAPPAILDAIIGRDFAGHPHPFNYSDYVSMVCRMLLTLLEKDLKDVVAWGLYSITDEYLLFIRRLALVTADNQTLRDRLLPCFTSERFWVTPDKKLLYEDQCRRYQTVQTEENLKTVLTKYAMD